jgi:hypothetical protein
MFKRNTIPLLYCAFFPVLIGIALFVVPEFSSLVHLESSLLGRVTRALITFWLMWAYANIGISFIPNLESSSIALFNTWGKYYNFLDNNHDPRVDRSIFPLYYFLPAIVVCAFASFLLLLAISTFMVVTFPFTILIASVNFLLLLVPRVALYNKVVNVVYVDEPS